MLRGEKDSSSTISTTPRMPAGVIWLAGSTINNTLKLCLLLGSSSKQNLVSSGTVDYGINLCSAGKFEGQWGKEN